MSNSGPEDYDLLEDSVDMTREDYEDTIYKKNTGWITDNTVYPYSKLSDFKDLTPEEIITRRLYLIHPNVAHDKSNLTKSQREAVIRLGMLKNFSKEKQEKMRGNFINQMVKEAIYDKQDESGVEKLVEEAKVKAAKDLEKRIEDAEIDGELQARLKKLSGTKNISQAEFEKRVKELLTKGGSKRKTSKRKTSKRKTSKRKTSKRKTSSAKRTKRTSSSSTKRKASSSIKHKSILKRRNKKGKKTTKKRMVSFYL